MSSVDNSISGDRVAKGRDHTVILIHGIRTRGEGHRSARHTLERLDSKIHAVPVKYGFFDVFRFLSPFGVTKMRVIKRITVIIRAEIRKKPRKLSIIAHSFGTYIVCEIIKNERDIEFDRVILCGSIVKDDFAWEDYEHRLAAKDFLTWKVVNNCGTSDRWSVLALTMSADYGSSGRFGFGGGVVEDRFHPIGHSSFFDETFIEKFWSKNCAHMTQLAEHREDLAVGPDYDSAVRGPCNL